MSILMALAGSALSVGSIIALISNVAGVCNGMTSLIACAAFVFSSIAAADGWYKMLGKNKKA